MASSEIILETQGKIAIITLNVPQKLNALSQDLYYQLSSLMRKVATQEDIFITLLIGKGRFFSAYVPFALSFILYLMTMQRRGCGNNCRPRGR